MSLKDRTLFMTGGSRGIGLAIALRAARDGANVALLAKTAEPNPKLPGTIYSAAEEIEAAGGRALPIVGDVRDPDSVAGAVAVAAERFGGIDVCVNNASAINLKTIEETEVKRYDLMQSINSRGTFLAIRACIPHLKRGTNPHILTLSPPIELDPRWMGAQHSPYTILTQPSRECTGNLFVDDEVLATLADPPVTDLERYRAGEGDGLRPDFFVDPAPLER